MKARAVLVIVAVTTITIVGHAISVSASSPRIPEVVQIHDPAGDARYQHESYQTGIGAPEAADLLNVWFTHTLKNVSVHIHVAAPPRDETLAYQVWTNPTDRVTNPRQVVDSSGRCFEFSVVSGGGKAPTGLFYDACDGWAGGARVKLESLPDGTAVITATIRRTWIAHRRGVLELLRPFAIVRSSIVNPSSGIGTRSVEFDRTEVGSSYRAEPQSRARRHCRSFTPSVPNSYAENRRSAREARLIRVTQDATFEDPKVVRYRHGASASIAQDIAVQAQVNNNDSKFFRVQAIPSHPHMTLHAQIEWRGGPPDDFDMYLFNEFGRLLRVSQSMNQLPDKPWNPLNWATGSDGGLGFESVGVHGVLPCEGFVVESDPYLTSGQDMRLKLWFR